MLVIYAGMQISCMFALLLIRGQGLLLPLGRDILYHV